MIPIILFLLWGQVFAAYVPIEGKAPQEISRILVALQNHPSYNISKKEIDSLIVALDQSFSFLKKDEVNLIAKSEILQTLITSPPTKTYSLDSLSSKSKVLGNLSVLGKNAPSSFWTWFILSLRNDLEHIMGLPDFALLQQAEGKKNGIPRKLKVIKKKLDLILPWYHYLMNHHPSHWEEKVFPLLLRCLKQVHYKISLYASLVPLQQGTPYFKEVKEELAKKPEESSLDNILTEVIEKHKKIKLPIPVDDWPIRDSDFADWETPLSTVKLSTEIKDPSELPAPVDDWITKEDLPRPTDDWPLKN